MRAHGTRAKYVAEKCRCPECREANRLYYHVWNGRRLRALYGADDPATVPADEARLHLLFLRRNGVGLRTVCRVTGLSRSSLDKLAKGLRGRVTWRTHDLVTGVHLGHKAQGRWAA